MPKKRKPTMQDLQEAYDYHLTMRNTAVKGSDLYYYHAGNMWSIAFAMNSMRIDIEKANKP